jgi:hypothetical protein
MYAMLQTHQAAVMRRRDFQILVYAKQTTMVIRCC